MAFESLSDKLQNIFKNLRKKGKLTEEDVKSALKEVKLAQTYILGLKTDGTALTAGLRGGVAPDVSHWTDVIGIETDDTYCVGIRQDGTLVFAGEHVFMGDGKNIQ